MQAQIWPFGGMRLTSGRQRKPSNATVFNISDPRTSKNTEKEDTNTHIAQTMFIVFIFFPSVQFALSSKGIGHHVRYHVEPQEMSRTRDVIALQL